MKIPVSGVFESEADLAPDVANLAVRIEGYPVDSVVSPIQPVLGAAGVGLPTPGQNLLPEVALADEVDAAAYAGGMGQRTGQE